MSPSHCRGRAPCNRPCFECSDLTLHGNRCGTEKAASSHRPTGPPENQGISTSCSDGDNVRAGRIRGMRQVRVLYTSGSVADATCRVPTNAGAVGSGPSSLILRQGLFGTARLTPLRGAAVAMLRRSSPASGLGRTRVLTESSPDKQKRPARWRMEQPDTPSGIIRRCAPHRFAAAVAVLRRSSPASAGSVERGFSPRAHRINKNAQLSWAFLFIGGESGIRTLGTVARTTDFESVCSPHLTDFASANLLIFLTITKRPIGC